MSLGPDSMRNLFDQFSALIGPKNEDTTGNPAGSAPGGANGRQNVAPILPMIGPPNQRVPGPVPAVPVLPVFPLPNRPDGITDEEWDYYIRYYWTPPDSRPTGPLDPAGKPIKAS